MFSISSLCELFSMFSPSVFVFSPIQTILWWMREIAEETYRGNRSMQFKVFLPRLEQFKWFWWEMWSWSRIFSYSLNSRLKIDFFWISCEDFSISIFFHPFLFIFLHFFFSVYFDFPFFLHCNHFGHFFSSCLCILIIPSSLSFYLFWNFNQSLPFSPIFPICLLSFFIFSLDLFPSSRFFSIFTQSSRFFSYLSSNQKRIVARHFKTVTHASR